MLGPSGPESEQRLNGKKSERRREVAEAFQSEKRSSFIYSGDLIENRLVLPFSI
jgi:hypothetical protein